MGNQGIVGRCATVVGSKALLAAIIGQAVVDLQADWPHLPRFSSHPTHWAKWRKDTWEMSRLKREVRQFFTSAWFEDICTALGWSPSWVRKRAA